MPRPMPAARAIRPRLTPPPSAACSCAKAGAASRSAMNAMATIREILVMLLPLPGRLLPFRTPLSSSPTGIGPGSKCLVVVADAERDVDRAQHREHERLDDAHEGAQDVEQHRYPDLREAGEDAHDLVVGEHVGEQPDAERDRAEALAEEFHHEH